jgi:hypothetical protein
MLKATVLAVVSMLMLAETSQAANFFASSTGTSAGDGSQARPWDLRTALSQPGAVRPGDTIWVRGGTYAGGHSSALNGTATAPIVVRNYNGERATVDGTKVGSPNA